MSTTTKRAVPSEINKCSVGTNTEEAATSPIKPSLTTTTKNSNDNTEMDLLQGYAKFLTESAERTEVLSQGYKFIHIMNE